MARLQDQTRRDPMAGYPGASAWSLELIGERLLVSEKTVKNCVTTLFRKEPLRRAPPQILA
jgi:hypothetical protein